MQKRIARKLELERLLSQIKPHPAPSTDLEQYTISTDAAARMLHLAAYVNGDIVGRAVLDLGCGTGRLSLGAAFLGAREVVGVDIDRSAVKVALDNSVRVGLKDKVQWVAADIEAVHGCFDTVLQNPPFGVQKRGADRKFLEKALEIGGMIYSLHKSVHDDELSVNQLKASGNSLIQVSPSSFLERFIENSGGKIKAVYALVMTVPHMFSFHTKRRHEFLVDLYVVEGTGKRE